MTDLGTNGQDGASQEPRIRRRRRWRGAVAAVGLMAIGAASGYAIGHASAAPWWMWGGGHHGFNAERMAKRVDHRVDRMLTRVDASDEQKGKVTAIAKTAITDIAALNLHPREMRAKFVELLRADTIDPAAFEALRAQQISNADAASKRAVQALTEAAAVLTPEQRRELTERWHDRLQDKQQEKPQEAK